jgi:hypothetical protein
MKRFLISAALLVLSNAGFATTIFFPEFDVFTQIATTESNELAMKMSYRMDMVIRSGIKYGTRSASVLSYNRCQPSIEFYRT